MKKLLLLTVLTISLFGCGGNSGQDINYEDDRYVNSDEYKMYKEKEAEGTLSLYTSGNLYRSKGVCRLQLTLNEWNRNISKGSKFLIKFQDGSVMELKCINYVDCNAPGVYNMQPSYMVTEEQIQKIIEKKAVKIRIETNNGFIDHNIENNDFSFALKLSHDAINRKINDVVEKEDVYSDF